MTDAEIVQTATNVRDGENDGDDEPTREVPTSTETRNLLRFFRNKVECRDGKNRPMRCVKQLEDSKADEGDAVSLC